MIGAADPLAWRPRIRREPDPRQGDLFAERRDEAAGLRAELDARRTWELRRRLRWALGRRR